MDKQNNDNLYSNKQDNFYVIDYTISLLLNQAVKIICYEVEL